MNTMLRHMLWIAPMMLASCGGGGGGGGGDTTPAQADPQTNLDAIGVSQGDIANLAEIMDSLDAIFTSPPPSPGPGFFLH